MLKFICPVCGKQELVEDAEGYICCYCLYSEPHFGSVVEKRTVNMNDYSLHEDSEEKGS